MKLDDWKSLFYMLQKDLMMGKELLNHDKHDMLENELSFEKRILNTNDFIKKCNEDLAAFKLECDKDKAVTNCLKLLK